MKQNHTGSNRRRQILAWAGILALPLAVVTASAQTTEIPASKVAAQTSGVVLIPATTGTSDWTNILSANIKVPNEKDLFITASLETGLFTATTNPPDSSAHAQVQVQVLLDDNLVLPGVVSYGSRVQTLDSSLSPGESLDLSQTTLDGASFSFIAGDVPVGVHTIVVQARVSTSGYGAYGATGAVGKGTLTVESVRLITDPFGIFEVN